MPDAAEAAMDHRLTLLCTSLIFPLTVFISCLKIDDLFPNHIVDELLHSCSSAMHVGLVLSVYLEQRLNYIFSVSENW